jgi:hypothetical protein
MLRWAVPAEVLFSPIRGSTRRARASALRGMFSATFFLACVAALELEQVVLEEI